MGSIKVHEFISLDGVIDAPAWSVRTVEDDPGAPFFNDTKKYVVSSTLKTATWAPSEVRSEMSRREGSLPFHPWWS